MKKLYYICSIALLVAAFNLPIAYYTFLRILIFVGTIFVIRNETKRDVNLLGITFIIVAILFNPFFPIYFYQKYIWIPIDIIVALLFGLYPSRK
jgi:hypothetical protein